MRPSERGFELVELLIASSVAALSLLASAPRHPSGGAKLVGLCMLAALFVVTSDLMGRPGMPAAIGRHVVESRFLRSTHPSVSVRLSPRSITWNTRAQSASLNTGKGGNIRT